MLLKRHPAYFSTKVLEELLSPLEPTPTLSVAPLDPNDTQSQTRRGPWKSHLSRHLVQRLHFGYYGTSRDLSANAVRYLTARARLEFGYFVIWGRAFWNVAEEDSQDVSRSQLDRDSEGKQGKKMPKAGENESLAKDESISTILRQSNHRERGRVMTADYAGASRLENNSTNKSVSALDDRQRIMQENRQCEEREERLLLLEAARFSARQPTIWKIQEQELKDSQFDTGFSFKRVASARHWRQVALTYFADPEDPEIRGRDAGERFPPSPFLGRLGDDRWMEKIKSLAITNIGLKTSLTTTTATAALVGTSTTTQPTSRLQNKNTEQENLAKVLDDCRLFQIASGIFEGLATAGRDKSAKQVDEPLGFVPEILESLIVDFGFMPLPEDDLDRRRHPTGGNRAVSGDGKRFPDDEVHCAKLKSRYGSIWKFYELQRLEIMVAYLMFRAPDVLDVLFDRGFHFIIQPVDALSPTQAISMEEDRECKRSKQDKLLVAFGLSPSLLLVCCLPRCHSMLRTLQISLTPNGKECIPPALIVGKIKRELLGYHGKPKRISFRREDFVQVVRGLPCLTLDGYKWGLTILVDLGMDISVVQDRIVEMIRIPGGPIPVEVEPFALTGLMATLHQDWSAGKCCECGDASSNAGSPIPGPAASPHPLAYSMSSNLGVNGSCLACSGPLSLSPMDLVNRTIQENFEIEMDLSSARDPTWRLMFETIVQRLLLDRLVVHPRVSDWIYETIQPTQSAFRTCFDHAVLEALQEVAEWNKSQVRRLEDWAQRQEDESRMKASKQAKLWRDLKDALVVDTSRNSEKFGGKRGRGSRGVSGSLSHLRNGSHGKDHDDASEDTILLDIDWTTGKQILQTTSSVVANMPKGSDMVRISDDGFLMLDNGCLDHELLLYDTRPLQLAPANADGTHIERGSSLDSNARVCAFLDSGALVQEKHLIWAALGLVTESFRGQAASVMRRVRSRAATLPSLGHFRDGQVEAMVIPVRMACSPEAYQLVWMLASTFVRQTVNNSDGGGGSSSISNSLSAAAAIEAPATMAISSDQLGGEQLHIVTPATGLAITSPLDMPPTSPVPAQQTSSGAQIKALQAMIKQRVGPEEAKLFGEILSEIEEDVDAILE
ncbi:hypothetical protein BG004_003183 [Podila humilis]|nr:hypothetical protein BG004_003183 [Podila humilis]